VGIFDFFKGKKKNKQKEELTFDMLMSYNNCNLFGRPNDYRGLFKLFKRDMIVGKGRDIIMNDTAILRYTNGAILSMIKVVKGEIISIIICDNNLLVENFSVPVKFENQRKNRVKIVEEIQLRIKNQRDLHQNKILNKLKEEEEIDKPNEDPLNFTKMTHEQVIESLDKIIAMPNKKPGLMFNKEYPFNSLTEEQLAFLDVINRRSISDWECKTQRGLTLDQVAAMHFQQYEDDEERIPEEDRKYVAGSRISSLNSLKTYIEEFGTEQQKFAFNSTVIASLLLTYTKISKYSDVVLFKLRKNHLMRNIETEMFSNLEETSKEYFAMLKKRAEEEQED
jgi:hypothetical protein